MFNYLYGGEREANSPAENDNPELALREAIAAHGTFAKKADGTLEWDDFVLFRSIVARQTERCFKQKRIDLGVRKLKAYREKNQRDYVDTFREGQRDFKVLMAAYTKKAGLAIEISAEDYKKTVDSYMGDAEKRS